MTFFLRIGAMNKNIHRYTRNVSTVIIVILFTLCLWQLAAAGWIQGKALIAQQLLQHSWQKTVVNPERSHTKDNTASTDSAITYKPWPWADTWPVAKLIVPQHDIEQIVLAGDNGSSLAFGPGYSLAGAPPNTPGTTMISAHRDTHFQFLADIQINDSIYLETPELTQRYQVYDLKIVDSRNYRLPPSHHEQTLVLATCFPFDAITPGGTLRYLVFANKKPI
jgi:sortase A